MLASIVKIIIQVLGCYCFFNLHQPRLTPSALYFSLNSLRSDTFGLSLPINFSVQFYPSILALPNPQNRFLNLYVISYIAP